MKNTLLILGAGASKAINHCFPTGFELLQSIHSHLFNDKHDPQDVREYGAYVSDLTNKVASIIKQCSGTYDRELRLYKKKLYQYVSHYEVKYLRHALKESISIDAFTNENKTLAQFQTISKYCTAHILKGSEHAYYESTNKKTETWLKLFLDDFTKEPSNIENISTRLHVISFNYDRVFAYLFKEYIVNHTPQFTSYLDGFEDKCIYYPYGSLGNLNEIPFESPNDDMQKMIRAYTKFQLLERMPKTWNGEKFDRIGFIGFGYDPTNFANLNLAKFGTAKIFSTCYNKLERQHHESQLLRVFERKNITFCSSSEELAAEILK
jgi:hypothetical protein